MEQAFTIEIIKTATSLGFMLVVFILSLVFRKFVGNKISKEQMRQVYFWAESFVLWAEQTFKGEKLGSLRKEKVMEMAMTFFSNLGIKLDEEILNTIIEVIVSNFNQTDWKRRLFDIDDNKTPGKEVIVHVGSNSEFGASEQI